MKCLHKIQVAIQIKKMYKNTQKIILGDAMLPGQKEPE